MNLYEDSDEMRELKARFAEVHDQRLNAVMESAQAHFAGNAELSRQKSELVAQLTREYDEILDRMKSHRIG